MSAISKTKKNLPPFSSAKLSDLNSEQRPFMSTKEAKKLLGIKYKTRNDSEVEYIVSLLTRISVHTVQDLGSKKSL